LCRALARVLVTKLKRAKAHVGPWADIVLNLVVPVYCLALRLCLSR